MLPVGAWQGSTSDDASVVNGLAADLVVGVEERLVQQVADVAAPEAIKHPAPVPASLDEAGEAQL